MIKIIRIAENSDVSEILKLYERQLNHMATLQPDFFKKGNQSEEFVLKMIEDDNSQIFLYIDEGNIQGFIITQIEERKKFSFFVYRKYAYVMDIFVSEMFRQKGIGKLLIGKCAEWARGKGADYIELDVLSNNYNGISFYEKLGFKERRRIMFLDLK